MSNHADLVSMSIHRRHVALAVASALLSLLLHVGFMAWVSSAHLGLPFLNRLRTPPEAAQQTMNLQHVDPLPAPVVRGAEEMPVAVPALPTLEAVAQFERPPDSVDIQPPASPGPLGAEAAPLATPPALPSPELWQPRQEIVQVDLARVQDDLATLARREIPAVERVPVAADLVYPAMPQPLESLTPAAGSGAGGLEAPPLADILRQVTQGPPPRLAESVRPIDAATRTGSGVLAESPAEITDVRPLDAVLSAGIATYTTRQDPDHGYFRIEIRRRSAALLPVIPKDMLFIIDCSASMSEERLFFCRKGLVDSLSLLGPDDRFNIIAFRDTATPCFADGWSAVTPAARAQAETFVQGLTSSGETDLFTAIAAALKVAQQPDRPVIALLISDGHATAGLRDGAGIIREVTRANTGGLSFFTMGTTPQAYLYLLELLSYSNRGESRVVTQGRWAIPDVLRAMAAEVSQPVLGQVRVQVAAATPVEVYPLQAMNLYSDRPLVLHGRFPRNQRQVVLRATGLAGATDCDMIFDLDLDAPTLPGGEALRTEWARQKVWHLLGEHARTGDAALIPQLDDTARRYRIEIPHRRSL